MALAAKGQKLQPMTTELIQFVVWAMMVDVAKVYLLFHV